MAFTEFYLILPYFGLSTSALSRHVSEKERYAYLVDENIGNFQSTRDSMKWFSAIAWAPVISVLQVFSTTFI